MNCYYCGNIIDEEKNICKRCGKENKEISINLDSLIISEELTTVNKNDETVTNEIIESIDPTDKKDEKKLNDKSNPPSKKVVVKIKPKKK